MCVDWRGVYWRAAVGVAVAVIISCFIMVKRATTRNSASASASASTYADSLKGRTCGVQKHVASCSICLCEDGDFLRLSCSHVFHARCLARMLITTENEDLDVNPDCACPNCRHKPVATSKSLVSVSAKTTREVLREAQEILNESLPGTSTSSRPNYENCIRLTNRRIRISSILKHAIAYNAAHQITENDSMIQAITSKLLDSYSDLMVKEKGRLDREEIRELSARVIEAHRLRNERIRAEQAAAARARSEAVPGAGFMDWLRRSIFSF